MIKSEYFGDLGSARLRQEGWYQGRRVDITHLTQELIRHSSHHDPLSRPRRLSTGAMLTGVRPRLPAAHWRADQSSSSK